MDNDAFQPTKTCDSDFSFFIYIIMLVQGVGTLFPWNCFISASVYYNLRLCGSPYEASFMNVLSFTFNGTGLMVLLLLLRIGQKYSQQKIIIVSISANILVFAFMLAMVLITDMSVSTFYGLTICGVLLSAASSAFYQGAVFAISASYAPIYTQAVMTGQAIAGVANAVVGILSALAEKPQPDLGSAVNCEVYKVDKGTLIYFSFACFVLVAALASYLVLLKMSNQKSIDQEVWVEQTFNSVPTADQSTSGTRLILQEEQCFPSQSIQDAISQEQCAQEFHSIISTFKKISPAALAVALTFSITLMTFPSLTSKITSVKPPSLKRGFFSDKLYIAFSFVNFNVGDLLGRALSGKFQVLSFKRLWIFALSRTIFLFLFLCCKSENTKFPGLFNDDFSPIFFMFAFSVSNGYVGSLAMMYGPEAAHPKSAEKAATIMTLCLVFGCTVGSFLSFPVLFLSTGSFV